MAFFRMILILVLFLGVLGVTAATGQVYQTQPNSVQQPIRQMPLQTPPKTIVQNGITLYQQGQNQPNQPAAITDRTMPPGYGSPYPTGQPLPNQPISQNQPINQINQSINQPIKVAQNSGSVYGLPPQPQPAPNPTPVTAGQPHYQPVPLNPATPPVPANTETRRFVGHAEPTNRVVPFLLTPKEQQELDEFLVRWEKYSAGIKRYDVDFNMFIYDEAIPGSVPGKPYKTTFGYFKYIAKPLRFVYHVEGEWIGDKKVERDDKKNPQIYAEKIIIDEKAVFKYEFNAKTVLQVNVPPELIGKGIADSPLPLIFGAKADEMKKRFSMKIVTSEQYENTQVWLQAKPLLIEDQQEFSQIEIRLEKETLRAAALKKSDVNGKAFTVYTLHSTKTNDRLTSFLEDIKKWFTPTIPDGWKLDVNDWVLEVQMAQQPPTAVLPATPAPLTPVPVISAPATPQPYFGNQPQPPRNEIPLYQPIYQPKN
ncbi:MAG: hypothetical protein LBQ50_00860 [Planctomycetaceae bacterium]|jgi:TIGR03009 family protein|nr:hypothetical protein [Planctomycetaceae bacterium]